MEYLDNLFNINGKIALLTGGGGKLAGTIGQGLANAGATVILLDIIEENAFHTAKTIQDNGGSAIGLWADVLDFSKLEKIKNDIIRDFGKIDILINLAGGNMPGATIDSDKTIFDLNIDQLDDVMKLNFNGTVYPSLVFGKEMASVKKGSIINISSMAALRVLTRIVGYSASKAAVTNFTQWMATEMAIKFSDKIRVNAIAPGFFIGKQNQALLLKSDGSYTQRGMDIIHNTPMRRFGIPGELIGGVIYLASDASSFVTGIVLPVDGGFDAFSGV